MQVIISSGTGIIRLHNEKLLYIYTVLSSRNYFLLLTILKEEHTKFT